MLVSSASDALVRIQQRGADHLGRPARCPSICSPCAGPGVGVNTTVGPARAASDLQLVGLTTSRTGR